MKYTRPGLRFSTKKSLPSSKQKSHLGLSFKLVTSQVAIFQYCLKQMFTQMSPISMVHRAQGFAKSPRKSHEQFELSTPKDALRCKVSSKWSKANALAKLGSADFSNGKLHGNFV